VIDSRHYLVRYGRPGFIGRFASTLPLARAERVVVQGPRGVELGDVLVSPEELNPTDDGVILRLATPHDDIEAARLNDRGQEVLASASAIELPLAFIDVEVTLDGTAILHAVAWDACDATALLDELGSRFGLAVKLLDLSLVEITKDPTGCGKPGCGSESGGCSTCGTGGGCSTGSCSRGSVKSAEELTAYFSDLRQKMESAGFVRTPLS
jgi:cell fate regulator YaaT (PSP1 superfamily)